MFPFNQLYFDSKGIATLVYDYKLLISKCYFNNYSKMEAYKPYVDYILAGGVAETAYILSKEGALCGTNLPIKELPRYNF